MKEINQIHDKFFQKIFSDEVVIPRVAILGEQCHPRHVLSGIWFILNIRFPIKHVGSDSKPVLF